MTIGHVTFQPAHLSDAGYYQDKAAECEERAYWSQLPDVQALYRNLAAHWLELARNALASNHRKPRATFGGHSLRSGTVTTAVKRGAHGKSARPARPNHAVKRLNEGAARE
jgi:hypothetical protein